MIYGIGIDIVAVDRIEKSLKKHDGNFEQKIFTPAEIEYCQSRPNPPMHFAGRFAVKEAVLKSLGMGIGGVPWRDMEVDHHESGRPVLKINGQGQALLQSLNLRTIHISISHDQQYAIAQAIAEGQPLNPTTQPNDLI